MTDEQLSGLGKATVIDDAEVVDDARVVDEAGVIDDAEVVEGLPVLAEVRALEPGSPSAAPAAPLTALPAIQAAAAAATGFVAGAATLALVRLLSARRLSRAPVRQRARGSHDGLSIVGTRSFLVDVHLIRPPQE